MAGNYLIQTPPVNWLQRTSRGTREARCKPFGPWDNGVSADQQRAVRRQPPRPRRGPQGGLTTHRGPVRDAARRRALLTRGRSPPRIAIAPAPDTQQRRVRSRRRPAPHEPRAHDEAIRGGADAIERVAGDERECPGAVGRTGARRRPRAPPTARSPLSDTPHNLPPPHTPARSCPRSCVARCSGCSAPPW